MPGEKDYEIVAGPAHRASAAIAIQTAWRRFRIAKQIKEMKRLGVGEANSEHYHDDLEKTESSSLESSHGKQIVGRAPRQPVYRPTDEVRAIDVLTAGQRRLRGKYLRILSDMQSGESIRWALPMGNIVTARALIPPIQRGHYDDLDFKTPHFSRHLLSALKERLIDKDEFLTAHYLYDSLRLINNNTIADNPKAHITPYLLNATDYGEPYSPLRAAGATDKARIQLEKKITQHQRQGKPLTYYVVNLPYHISIAILYELSIRNTRPLSESQKKMWRYYISKKQDKLAEMESIAAEGDRIQGALVADRKIKFLLQILPQFSNRTVRERLLRFLLFMEPEWARFLLRTGYQNSFPGFKDIKKERESATLMASILITKSYIPGLIPSPSFSYVDDASPFISFIICPSKTFNTVLDALYAEHAVHVVAQLGGRAEVGQTMRMVRAWHDKPAAMYAYQPDYESVADEGVNNLYPSACLLDSPSRPTELCLEDLGEAPLTHGSKVYTAVRTHHDYYHAMIASLNTSIVRRLQHLHDEKGRLAKSNLGMSKALEKLVDLEVILPKQVLESINLGDPPHIRQYIELRALMYVFEEGHFDFTEVHEDKYLLLLDMHINPEEWPSRLYGRTPDELFNSDAFRTIVLTLRGDRAELKGKLEDFEEKLNKDEFDGCQRIISRTSWKDKLSLNLLRLKQYLSMALEYKKMGLFLSAHPRLGVMGYILSKKLTPTIEGDFDLLNEMSGLGFENFFYWSRNTGVFIADALRGDPPYNEALLIDLKTRYDYREGRHEKSPFKLANIHGAHIRQLLRDMIQFVDMKKKKTIQLFKNFDETIRNVEDVHLRVLYASVYRICQPIDIEALTFKSNPTSPEFGETFFKIIFSKALPKQMNSIQDNIMDYIIKKNFTREEVKTTMIGSRLFLANMTDMAKEIRIKKGKLHLYGEVIEMFGLPLIKTHLRAQAKEINDVKRLSFRMLNCIEGHFKQNKNTIESKPITKSVTRFLSESADFFPPLGVDELGEGIDLDIATYIDQNARYIAYSRLVDHKHLLDVKTHFLRSMTQLLNSIETAEIKKVLIAHIKQDCCLNSSHFLNKEIEKTFFSSIKKTDRVLDKLVTFLDKASIALDEPFKTRPNTF